MIIIYDFDGTLTPYSLPQYSILKQCGYTDETIMARIEKEKSKFYEAYFGCYREILAENGIEMSKSNVCLGAQQVQLNNGVLEYFRRFQSSKTGIKHYILTSGIMDYVASTPVAPLVDGIYGVTFTQKDGIFQDIDCLLTDKKKVDMIDQIRNSNRQARDVIYFGDGLTDKFAFEHIHSIGGTNVFVAASEHAKSNYQKLNANGIIHQCFDADFRDSSKISNFIEGKIKGLTENEGR